MNPILSKRKEKGFPGASDYRHGRGMLARFGRRGIKPMKETIKTRTDRTGTNVALTADSISVRSKSEPVGNANEERCIDARLYQAARSFLMLLFCIVFSAGLSFSYVPEDLDFEAMTVTEYYREGGAGNKNGDRKQSTEIPGHRPKEASELAKKDLDYSKRRNVALGKEVTASSFYDSRYKPSNVVDGVVSAAPGHSWASMGQVQMAWIRIDFKGAYFVDQIRISSRFDGKVAGADKYDGIVKTLFSRKVAKNAKKKPFNIN
jgi:hypothetical protein